MSSVYVRKRRESKYEPYKKLGGNGSALRVMQEVNKLLIRNQGFEGMGGK